MANQLMPGDRAPDFGFAGPDGKRKALYSEATGGPLVLFFLPAAAGEAAMRELDALADAAPAMLQAGAHLFVVGADPSDLADRFPEDLLAAADDKGSIARLYGTGGAPLALVLDPNQRVMARFEPSDQPLADRARIQVEAAPRAATFTAPRHPPVLSIPRVLSPADCRRLIDHYESQGGTESGTYSAAGRRIDHETKRRQDCMVTDPALVDMLTTAMGSRVFPEITRAFQAKMTRVEELKVVRYDSTPGGYFRPHRDNMLSSGAHRRFAMTLNLNAEAYDGGRLRFPEYGGASYKPATGEAVIFSCSLMHEATDVESGLRYVLLSFLYDEEGEQLRQALRRERAKEKVEA